MTAVHFVLPEGIDDPRRPSGGNVYDRQVCRGLTALGWSVHEHAVPGAWPCPGAASLAALADLVARLADGALVLLDGLVACTAPEALIPQAHRLRLVVLVHMPLGHRPAGAAAADARRREGAVLGAAAGVVTTSAWTQRRLRELYGLPAERLHVASPGVDAAALATGTADGGALLCVAAVTFAKGHDLLIDALHATAQLPWRCACVGSLDREPAFVRGLYERVRAGGLGERVSFAGPRTGVALERAYAAADVMVLASRAETYGMVVAEALARGLPVIAAAVGGLGEALGSGADGMAPGMLVAPEDPAALAGALAAWLRDAELRQRLRRAARERRDTLSSWASTASALAAALCGAGR